MQAQVHVRKRDTHKYMHEKGICTYTRTEKKYAQTHARKRCTLSFEACTPATQQASEWEQHCCVVLKHPCQCVPQNRTHRKKDLTVTLPLLIRVRSWSDEASHGESTEGEASPLGRPGTSIGSPRSVTSGVTGLATFVRILSERYALGSRDSRPSEEVSRNEHPPFRYPLGSRDARSPTLGS